MIWKSILLILVALTTSTKPAFSQENTTEESLVALEYANIIMEHENEPIIENELIHANKKTNSSNFTSGMLILAIMIIIALIYSKLEE